jgi:hypothetical protein
VGQAYQKAPYKTTTNPDNDNNTRMEGFGWIYGIKLMMDSPRKAAALIPQPLLPILGEGEMHRKSSYANVQ